MGMYILISIFICRDWNLVMNGIDKIRRSYRCNSDCKYR